MDPSLPTKLENSKFNNKLAVLVFLLILKLVKILVVVVIKWVAATFYSQIIKLINFKSSIHRTQITFCIKILQITFLSIKTVLKSKMKVDSIKFLIHSKKAKL